MKVAITGGTGYAGPAVVEEMLREGHEVVVVEHRQSSRLVHPRLTRAKASIDDVDALRLAFEGCEAVAHLVAIIRPNKAKGITFEHVHVRGTENVVKAAKAAGVKRFLLMSANGADSGLHTPYFDTKLRMEEIVKAAGLEWTIFRPSYIAGSEDGGFDKQFADIVDAAPVLPSFAGGRFEIQPISRRNVGQAFARAVAKRETVGKTYVLAGPERMTWNAYLRKLAAVRGRKRPLVPAPRWGILPVATLAGPLFPADPDALRMLMMGNVGDPSDAVKDLGLQLERWEDAVAGLRR